jgi:hypothetical protein
MPGVCAAIGSLSSNEKEICETSAVAREEQESTT